MSSWVGLVPYLSNDDFLKDLEEAICDMTWDTLIAKDTIERSGKNIDYFLQTFL